MKEIPLSKGMVALVDDEDFESVSKYQWNAELRDHCWYARCHNRKFRAYLHHLILKPESGYMVDHRDGNGLNCQRFNLRAATNTQNNANSRLRTDNTSGYKGVTWCKSKRKWQAQITHLKKYYHLGVFDNPADAAKVYDAKAIELFGEFARPNAAQTPPRPPLAAAARVGGVKG